MCILQLSIYEVKGGLLKSFTLKSSLFDPIQFDSVRKTLVFPVTFKAVSISLQTLSVAKVKVQYSLESLDQPYLHAL